MIVSQGDSWIGGKVLEERSCNNAKSDVSNISRDVWTELNRFCIPNKVKEIHIKILHR